MVQVSRFDALKDPIGVIEGHRILKQWVDCQLVLAGGSARDDPDVFVLNLPPDSDLEINALQRAADVIVQKSIGEGFGLVVTEAMWKAKPVIGGSVGGIRRQIVNGVTGILVDTPEGMAYQTRNVLRDQKFAGRLGSLAHEQVRL